MKSFFVLAQPSYIIHSYSEFCLGNKSDTLTLEQIKKENIKFYSYSDLVSSIQYKKSNHLFSFKSHDDVARIFIVSKTDTLLIKLPLFFGSNNKKFKVISIKNLIDIKTMQYNFDTDSIKSSLRHNTSYNITENGTCKVFYLELPKMEKLVITKDKFKHLKELEIVAEE